MRATIIINASSVTMEVNSWLWGTWPFSLAFSSFFRVGCSVLSAAGFSGIISTRQKARTVKTKTGFEFKVIVFSFEFNLIGQQFAHPIGELSDESVNKG